jgi:hypothetical protein
MPAKLIPSIQGKSKIKGKLTNKKHLLQRENKMTFQ